MARPAQHLVTSPDIWRLMLAPARMEIIEAMRCIAPCSIAELAEMLDRPADGLYQHIRALQGAGIIVSAGYLKRGKHVEAVLDLSADDYRIAFADATGDAERAAIVETAGTFCRALTRCTMKAADAKAIKLAAGERNLMIEYDLTWLDDGEFAELRRLVTAVHRLCEKGRQKRGSGEGAAALASLYSVLCMAMPVVRTRHAKAKAGGGAKPEPVAMVAVATAASTVRKTGKAGKEGKTGKAGSAGATGATGPAKVAGAKVRKAGKAKNTG